MVSFALKLEPRGQERRGRAHCPGRPGHVPVPEFQECLADLAESGRAGRVVDLAETTFVDTRACRAPLRAARRLRDQGALRVVVNQDAEVRRVLASWGSTEFLTVVATRSQASTALTAA
jgi:anti-anti-sigma regulatory factor